ncbi:MAG: protein kinase [Myxococcota bacterium]
MIRCLGKGGFGEVYLARMSTGDGPGVEVAVKLLHASLGDNDQAVRRMKDEGRVLKRLSHPHILEVVDLTRLDGRVALITEYVEGADLSTLIKARDLPPRVAVEVVGAVAHALHAAWTTSLGQRGPLRLVHRDVKPSNIRIGHDGRVKLLDFGIARSDEVTRGIVTASDLLVGSAPYLAPERFRKGPPLPASDVFALGATAYEALAGERLVNLAIAPQAAHSLDPDLWGSLLTRRLVGAGAALEPAALRSWVAGLLVHDPEGRPTAQRCAEHAAALAEVLPGPGLAVWARTRGWTPHEVPGHLVGQRLVEAELPSRTTEVRILGSSTVDGSLATVPAEDSLEVRSSTRQLVALFAGIGVLAALFVTAAVAAGLAVGLGPRGWPGDPSPAVIEAVVAPAPPKRAGSIREPARPAVAIPARPAPEANSPPKPAPRAPEPARILVDVDGHDVWIVSPDGRRIDLTPMHVAVAPGTYDVWAVFPGEGARRAIAQLTLGSGRTYTIHCDWRLNVCKPE